MLDLEGSNLFSVVEYSSGVISFWMIFETFANSTPIIEGTSVWMSPLIREENCKMFGGECLLVQWNNLVEKILTTASREQH